MSFTYNGTNVQGVTYNGTNVQSITYNGVEVWSAIKPSLKDNTPAQIQYAAQHDLAASLWDVGDYFEMTLNGNWDCVGNTISLSNYKIRCVLIGINHNADKEGNHMLHFRMGKNTNNVDVAFYCSEMNSSSSKIGWKSCDMRTITLANLYNTIIPSNWRAVIKPCTKYTDNTGGGSNIASYVTSTSDNCFLLAEFEVFGSQDLANSAEQKYQKQYAYYANGNSNICYRHDSPTTAVSWWMRSVKNDSGGYVCLVYYSKNVSYSSGSSENVGYSAMTTMLGFTPAFCIG